MTAANSDAFRAAYAAIRVAGYHGTCREFARLVLAAPALFRRGLAASARRWWVERDRHGSRLPIPHPRLENVR